MQTFTAEAQRTQRGAEMREVEQGDKEIKEIKVDD
jgi:hypothetical protein